MTGATSDEAAMPAGRFLDAAVGEDGSVWAFGGVVGGVKPSQSNPAQVALR